MSVTKADLERAKKVAPVDLSEWMEGDSTDGYVCNLSTANTLKLPVEEGDDVSEEEAIYRWIIFSFCDAEGALIFEDNDESRQFLGDRPQSMNQAICEAAMTVNGVGRKGQQATAKN
jgi:hypothetical protein